MSKKRFTTFIIFTVTLLVMPSVVFAKDINYGACITMFGTMEATAIGGPANSVNDFFFPLDITNHVGNSMRSTKPESFDVHTKAPTSYSVNKIKSIEYSISYMGQKSCQSSILGKDIIEANNGYIMFHVELTKGFIDSMTWEVEAINTTTGQTQKFNKSVNVKLGDPNVSSDEIVAGNTTTTTTGNDKNKNDSSDDVLNPYQTPQNAMKGNCDESFRTGFLHKYWRWIMLLTPVLLIVMITIDFVKALSNNDADAIKKSSTNAVKRVIAGVILLALPMLLDIIFGWFGLEICF
ncbi:MAG: hypothetical protein U0M66_03935 [Bacilli bacterium]|nr:hypothetical protein [Bacilli bacterium]